MTTRGLYVFEHESSLGNAPAHKLFELIGPELKDRTRSPRAFADYRVAAPKAGRLDAYPGVELKVLC